jgi:hypothetical protein
MLEMSQLICVHSVDPNLIADLSMTDGKALDLAKLIAEFATTSWS